MVRPCFRNPLAAIAICFVVFSVPRVVAQPAQNGAGIRTIDVPNAGRIYLGALAGQPAPPDAMGKVLKQVEAVYGDRPQLGKQVKNTTGEILAAFFTVAAKKQDGKSMQGLAIVYAPKSGSAGGAVLIDSADRFSSTVNTMFTRLKQELGKAPTTASGAPATGGSTASSKGSTSTPAPTPVKSGPAQPLQTFSFPDGTGVIGLPAGWQMQQAQKGDVAASGPNGEKLRFGWAIAAVNNNRVPAPGNFVAITYGTDPAQVFTSVMTQMTQKARQTPPDVQISKVQDIPMQGGKNSMLYGTMDFHDNRGPLYLVAQLVESQQMMAGTWQMNLYVIYGPQQVMAAEGNTIAEIFPSYSKNNRQVNAIVNTEMAETIAITNQYTNYVAQVTDSTDRMTAGMSNMLRDQTVVVDTRTGAHATASDDLAGALIDANPGRFQSVSPSGYISGIDY